MKHFVNIFYGNDYTDDCELNEYELHLNNKIRKSYLRKKKMIHKYKKNKILPWWKVNPTKLYDEIYYSNRRKIISKECRKKFRNMIKKEIKDYFTSEKEYVINGFDYNKVTEYWWQLF